MIQEKSCGAVIFRKNNETKYLLLHYESSSKQNYDYWDYPKGHVEEGEDELATVKREVEEETGITDIKFIENFKERIQYFFKRGKDLVKKEVIFYLLETKTEKVKISFEHIGYKWLNYKEALEQLTFKNAKEILEKADKFLKNAKDIQKNL